jgi:hypothetical protein
MDTVKSNTSRPCYMQSFYLFLCDYLHLLPRIYASFQRLFIKNSQNYINFKQKNYTKQKSFKKEFNIQIEFFSIIYSLPTMLIHTLLYIKFTLRGLTQNLTFPFFSKVRQ